MLTDVIRLLRAIETKEAVRGVETRPTLVVVPLSPNHGVSGSDGMYIEFKISLQTLAQRWSSEGWSSYLSISGAVIGSVLGTGLVEQSNSAAEALGKFSPVEMTFKILGLLSLVMSSFAQIESIQMSHSFPSMGAQGRLLELSGCRSNSNRIVWSPLRYSRRHRIPSRSNHPLGARL